MKFCFTEGLVWGWQTPQLKLKGNFGDEVTLMAIRQPRYSKEEFARRERAIYDSQARSQVEANNFAKVVAIDII